MKTKLKLLLAACALAARLQTAHAQLSIPSDGSDGDFAPAGNYVVDLSQAVTGKWDADNTANAGKGVYDPEKWAVVFKYKSVNVAAGANVTFKNHTSRAPVVWLVQGDAIVAGQIIVTAPDGPRKGTPEALIPSESGPGGFRGGPNGPLGYGAGLGPGGGFGGLGRYASSYGNPSILPLIGGSGGGNGSDGFDSGSAGGGGAIMLEGVVDVWWTAKFGGRSSHRATYVSGDFARALWKFTTTFPDGFSTLQARATAP
jgi:hypothetical protein